MKADGEDCCTFFRLKRARMTIKEVGCDVDVVVTGKSTASRAESNEGFGAARHQ